MPDCKEPSERGTENGVQRCGSPYYVGILVTIAHFMSSHVYKHTLCINEVQLAYKCTNSWLLIVTELPPLASRRRSFTMKLVRLVLKTGRLRFLCAAHCLSTFKVPVRSNNSSKEHFSFGADFRLQK